MVHVDSLDEAIKKVEAAGGKLVQPKKEIPDMFWYAIVEDTEGNEISLAQDIRRTK